MYITKKNVIDILDAMEDFEDATSFKLVNDNSSGIGGILSLIVTTVVKNRPVEIKIEISGVENW
jgi:hypothetical protein